MRILNCTALSGLHQFAEKESSLTTVSCNLFSGETWDIMQKRQITPAYIVFYILFLPDTWQILIGIVAAVLLVPLIVQPDMGTPARIMLYIMTATIGYAASRAVGRWVAQGFKKLILGAGESGRM